MIALLHEKRIKNYDILMIQESWRHHEEARTYNSCGTDFTLKNNEEKTCFYVNNRIDDNNWHSTWHFKNVEIITLQLRPQDEEFSQDSMNTHEICSMNIYEMYNSSSINYNEVSSKGNLPVLKQALSMSNESVIVSDFNLHHSHWSGSSYFKQHLLSNDLLIVMRFVGVIFSLFKNTVIRNYQKSKIIIDLSFATQKIVDRLIFCEVIHKMKNSSDHLFIDTIFDLRAQKKSKRRSKRNWKALNEKKFKNVIWDHLSEFLSNVSTNRQRIDNYITKLLQTLKEATERFTPWAKLHERTKSRWSRKCINIIKKIKRLRRECRTFCEWQMYVKACDQKDKIIKQHKKNSFRAAMQVSENFSKQFFEIAKWVKEAKKEILLQTIISSLKTRENVAVTTQNKVEVMFEIHFSSSSTIFMNDTERFVYSSSTKNDETMTRREIMKVVYKISSNKASKINEIINKTLRQLVRVIIEQIRFLFNRCIKESIQSSHFKKVFIIMLRKSDKKNYTKSLSYRSIALLNTLNKMLKSIVSERFRYAVEALSTFSNI